MTIFRENRTIRILNSLCNVSIDHFDERLRLQKLGYLAQKLGATGGFTFSWYRRGPYSPTLTDALYQCESAGELGIAPALTAIERTVVNRLNQLMGTDINNPRTLELFASSWYFLPQHNISGREKDEAIADIAHYKPQFDHREIMATVNRIIEFKAAL